MLKVGGRCGIVIKNTFLSNDDATQLRKLLLEECNLYAVLELPKGAFPGTVVKTVVMFFEKGRSTDSIWYYQLNPGRSLTKTNPINESDLKEFFDLEPSKKDSVNSWSVSISNIDKVTWDLSPVNPNFTDKKYLRPSVEILEELSYLKDELDSSMNLIKEII